LIKDGVLSDIDSIHRETIDRAAKRKDEREARQKFGRLDKKQQEKYNQFAGKDFDG